MGVEHIESVTWYVLSLIYGRALFLQVTKPFCCCLLIPVKKSQSSKILSPTPQTKKMRLQGTLSPQILIPASLPSFSLALAVPFGGAATPSWWAIRWSFCQDSTAQEKIDCQENKKPKTQNKKCKAYKANKETKLGSLTASSLFHLSLSLLFTLYPIPIYKFKDLLSILGPLTFDCLSRSL